MASMVVGRCWVCVFICHSVLIYNWNFTRYRCLFIGGGVRRKGPNHCLSQVGIYADCLCEASRHILLTGEWMQQEQTTKAASRSQWQTYSADVFILIISSYSPPTRAPFFISQVFHNFDSFFSILNTFEFQMHIQNPYRTRVITTVWYTNFQWCKFNLLKILDPDSSAIKKKPLTWKIYENKLLEFFTQTNTSKQASKGLI